MKPFYIVIVVKLIAILCKYVRICVQKAEETGQCEVDVLLSPQKEGAQNTDSEEAADHGGDGPHGILQQSNEVRYI